MTPGGDRITRVEEQIRREVAAVLTRAVADPASANVTVLWAKVARDLSFADIYVSIFGDEAAVAAGMRALQRCRAFVQQEVAARIRLRKTPHLRFRLDEQYRSAMRVYEILNELEKDEENAGDAGDAGAEGSGRA